ncbi:hypothetical protein [Chryseobacterium sp. SG20098]|uniref:hypothetical protein n=1 Tax=Chryseobacterium sp. SG20098 TaxID=3074145 RepID=UPI0028833B07|nr:hypothetical protein [Chryseobacterium sp. SG20098]WNI37065.1 hypothetical protein RHP76_01075 [Chryseobacterium sp. SG20098]
MPNIQFWITLNFIKEIKPVLYIIPFHSQIDVNEHTEVKVDLLFTLDIAAGWDSDNIPSNVKTAVNYYNKNDGFMGSSIGGEDIEAKDPLKTKILNVPVNASHTEIDNKYRYNAYNAVVKELNKSEEKKP